MSHVQENVGRLAHAVPTFSIKDTGKLVHSHFETDPDHEGVLVMDGETPVGIIMRQDFYQKIGKEYGFSIYMNRSVKLLMKEEFMKVDAKTQVAEVSLMAMNRTSDNLYDFIIAMDDGKYIGIISIRTFLIDLAKKREEEILLLKDMNDREREHRLEIHKMNTSIKSLMDNAEQGFLSVDKQATISSQCSRECVEIFEHEIAEMNLLELLSPFLDTDQKRVLSSVIESVLCDDVRHDEKVYLSLLPKELRIGSKDIRFEYKIVNDASRRTMMLILTNVTAKKEFERKMAEERTHLKMIVKAVLHRNDVVDSIESLKEYLSKTVYDVLGSGRSKQESISEIFRSVHTFKGDLGHLHFSNTAKQLHALEDHIVEMIERIEQVRLEDIRDVFESIRPDQMLAQDLKRMTDILGKDFFSETARLYVPLESILKIENMVKDLLNPQEKAVFIPELYKLRCSNLKDILNDLDETVQVLASRLGKGVKPLHVIGDDILIDRSQYNEFIRSLMHVFRNAVDHGLETPEERNDNGKDALGRITCNLVKCSEDQFRLTIADDGKGIDTERILSKAIEKGILSIDAKNTLDEAAICQLLFLDSFSTKDTVSMLSGRGVGLSAVKTELEKLGGSILVESQSGIGTSIIMEVPVKTA